MRIFNAITKLVSFQLSWKDDEEEEEEEEECEDFAGQICDTDYDPSEFFDTEDEEEEFRSGLTVAEYSDSD